MSIVIPVRVGPLPRVPKTFWPRPAHAVTPDRKEAYEKIGSRD
ncbi:MAG: hypothetical protein M0024_05875 [Nitrospiraceae bacterium]|nr:hypothetical protein [Nitrospiraceae bacterium]